MDGEMATKLAPLLCELHAHTTWSDGALTPRELCDLYGRAGFDVLAITDHTLPGFHIQEADFERYVAELDEEGDRARRLYDLLVIPGLELTVEADDPIEAGHALAIGLRRFVDVADGLEPALRAARAHGAALVAAHPYLPSEAQSSHRRTGAFASDPARWAPLVDRFELFNRDTLFAWVAAARLPAVACGDAHVAAHLATWKTLLPCAKDERAVVDYLCSPRPAFLARLEREQAVLSQAA
jgi:predicted metal-dependent phosphoesterase TrpH